MNRNGDTASIFFYSLCSEVYSWSVFGALFSHTAGGTGSAELQKLPQGPRWLARHHLHRIQCRLCSMELSYINKSTSSMLMHYRARHGNEESADTAFLTSKLW
ncbi:uncharacterized protein LOC103041110 isoform X8 [Astyanax mexicanus]|uniref:uncharacterized protein LOC103041110 isoform X8 n=1 Tax=Astyanax mexicanus TaxID=7994 RepID=UPI0020CABA6C|nr:uncharacterized protein LOC103041110 isoform X8 [Astyanax mexicanus]